MKESYSEGIANHAGLGSYAVVREGGGGTLTEVRAGRVLSREMPIRSGRRCRYQVQKATRTPAEWRAGGRPCEVGDPRHARKHTIWRLGDPTVVCESGRPCRKV